MPIGRSGNYHMNPHEMRRKGDAPDEKPGATHDVHAKPEGEDGGGEEGDGNHHHEIHEREDGTAHSIHTHPDGHTDEMDHNSYAEAVQNENQQRGGEGEEQTPEDGAPSPDMDDGSDMAGMYASHCK